MAGLQPAALPLGEGRIKLVPTVGVAPTRFRLQGGGSTV